MPGFRVRPLLRPLAALLAISMVAAGCGGDDAADDVGTEAEDKAGAGKTVMVAGAFIEAEATNFEKSIKAFEDRTGIDVKYEGSKDFTEQLTVRVAAGDPPDVAMLPQPGRLLSLAAENKLVTLDGTP